ncbi:MAG: bifunctional phosphoribosylaminoimidazolecarboxamide formyltransferase/IMP cyclohydrolase [Bdellovibrionales bacterium RIFOXYA1_FULL_36_14]|nr:MAG: bifunctional phosphoribosylaminoimidazolecarboxamide formyltransferase/IMP cyclohydrolase [Bdellovibrionales bacterium RIFOXYA1_FULL_36_14]
MRALISVSNKSNLQQLAQTLVKYNIQIISTGGTGKVLKDLDINYIPIENITGNPEAFNGRMKTISFQVLSAILYNRNSDSDVAQAQKLGIQPIDLVVCNLYPFMEVVKNDKYALESELVENIDIGGPTMIRAAAKNFESVTILTNSDQYDELAKELEINKGTTTLSFRKKMALAAYQLTSAYDSFIASTFEKRLDQCNTTIYLNSTDTKKLRYGENPHQKAWLYKNQLTDEGLAYANPIQGKELSHNNYLDADAAIKSNQDISQINHSIFKSACTIIKHLNPCGAALAKTPLDALKLAWNGDPISSFGSIICFNQEIHEDIPLWLDDKFVEVIIAPAFSAKALTLFSKKKNLRLIPIDPSMINNDQLVVRSISGGFVVQTEDLGLDLEFQTVSKTLFPSEKKELAHFAIMVTKHLRSNAIGLVCDTPEGFALAGAGMGNPNRVISLQEAINKAKENNQTNFSEMVLASDAFFPFADSIELAKTNNIKYIIEPGGSIRDDEVIKACNENNISLVFTGTRHFRH